MASYNSYALILVSIFQKKIKFFLHIPIVQHFENMLLKFKKEIRNHSQISSGAQNAEEV